MTPTPPRARLHSSSLLHFLDEKALLDCVSPPGDVGQHLAGWLDFRQAIALQAFIGSVDDPQAVAARPSARVDGAVLRQRFAQVRQALERAIREGTPPAPGLPPIEPPGHELAHPIDPRTAFEPLRRFSQGQQRQMENILRSLRAQLRGMLDKGTTPQRQLAALDAIFDTVLQTRQTRLLAQITARFEQRFALALRQHMKTLEQATQADEPPPPAAVWLGPLCDDMRQALLAELDLRLQPLLGLIEALTPSPPDASATA